MYSIGEAARRSGVAVETIRYYERASVVPLPDRAASGRRLYDSAGIARLRFVKRCRDLGFSIEDIRTLLALSKPGSKACSDVKRIGEGHLRDVREKIADLTRLESALAEMVAECGEQKPECPVLRQLFAD